MQKLSQALLILCLALAAANAQTGTDRPDTEVPPAAASEKEEKDPTIAPPEPAAFADVRRTELVDYLNRRSEFLNRPAPGAGIASTETGEEETDGDDESDNTSEPAEKVRHKYEVQLNYSVQSLSGGYGLWQIASVHFQRRSADKKILWGQYRVSQRRSFRDQEYIGGIYKPLGRTWAFTAEGMYSPSGNFVGRYSAMSEIEKVFAKGWVGHLGVRHTSYTRVKATTGYGLVEKYWGSHRLANTLYVTTLSNAGTAPSYRLQYNRYYGERVNTFGAAFSIGREHENIGPPRGIIRTDTWSLSGSFKHWVNDNLGISADALVHRQGDIYYRRGLNFGVRYRF